MAQDPKTIGRYQVQSLLGRGGMGSVFLATDPKLKRQLVVKVVHEGGAGFAHAMERFQREAEISARLNHPNIIIVHDVGEDPQAGPFIAMEYVEGATLAGLIQQQSLGHESALKILVQAARGLMAAGQEGIVHRDVKPENILVGKDGRVKLTDFGIARTGESKLTTVGGVFGTPSYIAPELLVDAEASPATDTYAFAVTAYELLTGHLPFKGDSVASTLLRIVNDPPTVPDSVPAAPRAVFLRALAKKPGERYPDVFSFMAALIQAYPLPASTRNKLATLLAGDDVSLTGVPVGAPPPGRNTPLPSAQFPPLPTAAAPLRPATPSPVPEPVREPTPPQPLPPPEPPQADYATRAVSGPIAAPEPMDRSGPRAYPPPPESIAAAPARPSTKGGLLAVAASASGALLLLAGVFGVGRACGLGSRELSFDSHPSGAIVRIDGKELGLTPVVKARVARKAGRVELTLPGYESKTIALLPNDRDLPVIELKALPGTAGPAPPDAEIEAMRQKLKEAQDLAKKEESRLKRLRDQSSAPVPAAAAPAPPPAPAPKAQAPQPAASPNPGPPPAPLPTPAQSAPPARGAAEAERVTSPSVLRTVAPQYPSRALAARFEPSRSHRVVLKVFVDEAGKPGKVQVLEGVPGSYGFDESAKEAALQCSYAAGSRGGRPASGWVEIAFLFQPLKR